MADRQQLDIVIWAVPQLWNQAEFSYACSSLDMTLSGWIPVHSIPFEFDLPPKDWLIGQSVLSLRQAKQRIQEQAAREAANIDEQVGKLLAIAHEVAPPPPAEPTPEPQTDEAADFSDDQRVDYGAPPVVPPVQYPDDFTPA